MTAILYILMRNDLASMNCGKAIAQGSHASNAFVQHFHEYMSYNSIDVADKKLKELNTSFHNWENSTSQGFGTVIVLEGNFNNIKKTVDIMSNLGYISRTVFDPTYPLVDGSVVHHIPLETCGYVFVENKEEDTIAKALLSEYNLHH
jgi:peptidyl-tRNA hydrolase